MNHEAIREGLTKFLGVSMLPDAPRSVLGGSINECFRYATTTGAVFVKVAAADALTMFEAEAAGLNEIRFAASVRVPEVLGTTTIADHAVLALEWIDLHSSSSASDQKLGEQLASMHRITQTQFGWQRDNFIGSTAQCNKSSTDWLHFLRAHRFGPQLTLAERRGVGAHFMERVTLLSALMDGFFTSYIPDASLLHGDLWSGNYAVDSTGEPVLFDPAVYYGDRECDLAMTRLFGGFSRHFYDAYQDAWPLDEGWRERVDLYNLYHVLNHFNLFGGAYLVQAERMIEKLLAEIGH